jgi:DNA segregation ATPase FtsK/SpoIIIE, S-DNA-T family
VVVGDGSAGKTTFVRTWMRGLAARYTPGEVRFMVVDYRRGLGDTVPAPYIGARAGDARTAGACAERLAEVLAGRVPPAGMPARELRDRAWWTGPELYLVVDDYDLARVRPRCYGRCWTNEMIQVLVSDVADRSRT